MSSGSGFHWGWCVTIDSAAWPALVFGSRWRRPVVLELGTLLVVWGFHGLNSARLSSLREVAIVLFECDCSLHIPSRVTAHVHRERLCQLVSDAYLSTANSSPESPLHSKGRADSLSLAQVTAASASHAAAVGDSRAALRAPKSSPAYASSVHTRGRPRACSMHRSEPGDGLRSKTPCQRTLLRLPANLRKIVAYAAIITIFPGCTSVRCNIRPPRHYPRAAVLDRRQQPARAANLCHKIDGTAGGSPTPAGLAVTSLELIDRTRLCFNPNLLLVGAHRCIWQDAVTCVGPGRPGWRGEELHRDRCASSRSSRRRRSG